MQNFREWLYLLGQGISDFLQNIGRPVTEAEKRKRSLKRYEERQKRIGSDSASKPARQRVNEIESKQKLVLRARVASTVILAITLLASVAWIHRHLKREERKKELIVQIELALGEQKLATAFQLLTGYTIEIDREDLLKDRRFRKLWDKTGALRDEAKKSREKQKRLAAEEQRLNTERRKQELIGISKNSEGDFRKMAVRELFQIDRSEAGFLFRDLTPARVSGAFDFGNGPTEPDQPYRMKPAPVSFARTCHTAYQQGILRRWGRAESFNAQTSKSTSVDGSAGLGVPAVA